MVNMTKSAMGRMLKANEDLIKMTYECMPSLRIPYGEGSRLQ
jgi:hypothetical protein